jgi:GTPase-activating protein SST2
VEEYEAGEDASAMTTGPPVPPGLEDADEIGRTYMTVSQQANEKAQAAAAKEKLAQSNDI